MRRVFIALGALGLALLACGTYITPTAEAVSTPEATKSNFTTATAFVPTATITVFSTPNAGVVTVSLAVVTVRNAPDGIPTGEYLQAGQSVRIVSCSGDWCQIESPNGWVWRGCLSDNPNALGCEAK